MKNPSLLQRLSVATFKELMTLTPLDLMSDSSELLRMAVSNALTTTSSNPEGHFDVFRMCENMEVIGFQLGVYSYMCPYMHMLIHTYTHAYTRTYIHMLEDDILTSKDLSSCRVLVYIHGGGFVVRDCTDLIIAERLLPLIKEHPHMPDNVVIVSLLYPLARENTNNPDAILEVLLESINTLLQRGYKIDGIIGDSAGGYLTLQVSQYLTSKIIPKLSLMSPWLNLYSNADSYIRNREYDFLDLRFIEKARDRYLNRKPKNRNKDETVGAYICLCLCVFLCY